jgi:hypothetical protein
MANGGSFKQNSRGKTPEEMPPTCRKLRGGKQNCAMHYNQKEFKNIATD